MKDAPYFVHMIKNKVCFLMGGLCKGVVITLGGLSSMRLSCLVCSTGHFLVMWWWDQREIPLIFSKMITNNAIRGITNKAIRGYSSVISYNVSPYNTYSLLHGSYTHKV